MVAKYPQYGSQISDLSPQQPTTTQPADVLQSNENKSLYQKIKTAINPEQHNISKQLSNVPAQIVGFGANIPKFSYEGARASLQGWSDIAELIKSKFTGEEPSYDFVTKNSPEWKDIPVLRNIQSSSLGIPEPSGIVEQVAAAGLFPTKTVLGATNKYIAKPIARKIGQKLVSIEENSPIYKTEQFVNKTNNEIKELGELGKQRQSVIARHDAELKTIDAEKKLDVNSKRQLIENHKKELQVINNNIKLSGQNRDKLLKEELKNTTEKIKLLEQDNKIKVENLTTELRAKQLVEHDKLAQSIDQGIEGIGTELSSKYDIVLDPNGIGGKTGSLKKEIGEVVKLTGTDIKTSSKEGLLTTFKNQITETMGETSLNDLLKEGADLDNIPIYQQHKIKQILQEYGEKLAAKATTKDAALKIKEVTNSVVNKIENNIIKAMPKEAAISYKALGNDWRKYKQLQELSKKVAGTYEERGARAVGDVVNVHKEITQLGQYQSPEEIAQAMYNNNLPYQRYMSTIKNMKENGFALEAQALENKMADNIKDSFNYEKMVAELSSGSNNSEINRIDSLIKQNIDETGSKLSESRNNIMTKNTEKTNLLQSNKEFALKHDVARTKWNERRLGTKQQLDASIKQKFDSLPDTEKSQAYHLLTTSHYLSSIIPNPTIKAAIKGSAILYMSQKLIPKTSGIVGRKILSYVDELPRARLTANEYNLVKGFYLFMLSDERLDQKNNQGGE
jgi:hypothetical protein